MKVTAVLLAAGQGTRMKSKLQKVLHPVCGQPMIEYALRAAWEASTEIPVVIVGNGGDAVQEFVGGAARCIIQNPQLGTGHAVMQAESLLRGQTDLVLVTYADMPLLRPETLSRLVETQKQNPGALTLLTVIAASPRGFGRVVRSPDGRVQAIVEEAVATPEQLAIQELNVGAYCYRAEWLWEALHRIPLSKKGEYYLTDTVEIAARDGLLAQALICEDHEEIIGINTRIHLAEAEAAMHKRINQAHMLAGVTIVNPQSTYIEPTVTIGQDTRIWPNTYLQGETKIGEGCEIGPNAVIRDSVIGDHCTVLTADLEGVTLNEGTTVGPFACLRPDARSGERIHRRPATDLKGKK